MGNHAPFLYCCFLVVLSLVGCNNTNRKHVDNKQIEFVIVDESTEPLLLWFSKDSSSFHYFYGVPESGTISIMHIAHDLPANPQPLLTDPYNGFVKVLSPGDTLVIHASDSSVANDLRTRYRHELPFLSDSEIDLIRTISFSADSISLD